MFWLTSGFFFLCCSGSVEPSSQNMLWYISHKVKLVLSGRGLGEGRGIYVFCNVYIVSWKPFIIFISIFLLLHWHQLTEDGENSCIGKLTHFIKTVAIVRIQNYSFFPSLIAPAGFGNSANRNWTHAGEHSGSSPWTHQEAPKDSKIISTDSPPTSYG